MLRRTGPLDEWAERESPSDTAWRYVAETVFRIGREPWAWPSVPLTFPTGQPAEVREIPAHGTTVIVTYQHEHASGIVDLLHVDG